MEQMNVPTQEGRSNDLSNMEILRDSYMKALAHDVRNPLHTMTIYTECILADLYGELNKEQAEAIEELASASKLLTVLINNVFSIEQWPRNDMTSCVSDFDLARLTRDCVEVSKAKADTLGISLTTNCNSEYLPLRADRDKVQQMIHNTLSALVRVTKSKELTINVQQQGMKAIVRIIDSSMTLTAEELDAILRDPWQADNGRFGSRILGLAMAKAFCECNRGRFFVTSEGNLTCFTMEIPR
ncbi:hypothetical protein SCG7086_BS_00050 [Chlamydiales bacterium SCGC AG-110-P3]|nr:hypothetical protein SCG7086_BS_00050 [Chlamydiales bacterium SCGC AG-110-P3]